MSGLLQKNPRKRANLDDVLDTSWIISHHHEYFPKYKKNLRKTVVRGKLLKQSIATVSTQCENDTINSFGARFHSATHLPLFKKQQSLLSIDENKTVHASDDIV